MLWDGLVVVYGLAGLAERVQFSFENIREVIFKTRDSWSDNPTKDTFAMETAQVITILYNITFYCQMSGEDGITPDGCFIHVDEVVGPFIHRDRQSAGERKLQLVDKPSKLELLQTELTKATQDLNGLIEYTEVPCPKLQHSFKKTLSTLLDLLEWVEEKKGLEHATS